MWYKNIKRRYKLFKLGFLFYMRKLRTFFGKIYKLEPINNLILVILPTLFIYGFFINLFLYAFFGLAITWVNVISLGFAYLFLYFDIPKIVARLRG